MAGGRRNLTPLNMTDVEYSDKKGLREDGRDLIEVSLYLYRLKAISYQLSLTGSVWLEWLELVMLVHVPENGR